MISESFGKLSHEEKRLLARNAGKLISESPKAIIPFYRVMTPIETDASGNVHHVNEEAYFAALCIQCLFENEKGEIVDPAKYIALGRKSNKLGSIDGYDRRISSLMGNTEPEYFVAKLTKLMSYTKQLVANKIPDCDRLYKDICSINNTNKYIQKRWARIIYTEGE